jgi:hypothetical protein
MVRIWIRIQNFSEVGSGKNSSGSTTLDFKLVLPEDLFNIY